MKKINLSLLKVELGKFNCKLECILLFSDQFFQNLMLAIILANSIVLGIQAGKAKVQKTILLGLFYCNILLIFLLSNSLSGMTRLYDFLWGFWWCVKIALNPSRIIFDAEILLKFWISIIFLLKVWGHEKFIFTSQGQNQCVFWVFPLIFVPSNKKVLIGNALIFLCWWDGTCCIAATRKKLHLYSTWF